MQFNPIQAKGWGWKTPPLDENCELLFICLINGSSCQQLSVAARHLSSWICALYICIIDCAKKNLESTPQGRFPGGGLFSPPPPGLNRDSQSLAWIGLREELLEIKQDKNKLKGTINAEKEISLNLEE